MLTKRKILALTFQLGIPLDGIFAQKKPDADLYACIFLQGIIKVAAPDGIRVKQTIAEEKDIDTCSECGVEISGGNPPLAIPGGGTNLCPNCKLPLTAPPPPA